MLRATNIDRYCVRISVKDAHDIVINQGSGVIIKTAQNYYVLTARHCVVVGDKDTAIAGLDSIWIESQTLYNAPFQRIPVISLIKEDKDRDWALLNIGAPPLHEEMPVTLIGENPRVNEAVVFRGFQGRDSDQSRRFNGILNEIGQEEFKITLDKDTFLQGGQLGADVAKGLSGSGVFMYRNEKLYLIGHLKSVVDEFALNDDIKCCVPASWKEYLPDSKLYDLNARENLPWSEDRRKLNEILIRRVFIELQKFRPSDTTGGGTTTAEGSVVANYIAVIAVEIRRLGTAAKGDKKDEETQSNYIRQAVTTARRCIQLLTFIFLSRWWDNRTKLNLKLDDQTKNELRDLLGSASEPSITEYLSILKSLIAVYKSTPLLESPIDELNELDTECQPGRDFHDAFGKLAEIEKKLEDNNYDLTDCFTAEAELTIILETLAFLSTYNMAAIKEVVYHQVRNNNPRYQHSYCEIREYKDHSVPRQIARINYTHGPVSTDTVFFYKKDYEKGVTLSPFVIDLNSIDARSGAKIYFYRMRDNDDNNILIYTCVNDAKDEGVQFSNSPDDMPGIANVLMEKTSDTYLDYRKDVIHRLFTDAQKDILS